MKVIFLDVDGVLNTDRFFKQRRKYWNEYGIWITEIEEFRIEYLRRIVDATGAKIVLSSSWRLMFNKEQNGILPIEHDAFVLYSLLLKYNLLIYDITGQDRCGIRQNEINEWLNKNHDVESFVVIDDSIMGLEDFIDKNLIQTYFYDYTDNVNGIVQCAGLCEEHIEQAINILNNNKLVKKRIK